MLSLTEFTDRLVPEYYRDDPPNRLRSQVTVGILLLLIAVNIAQLLPALLISLVYGVEMSQGRFLSLPIIAVYIFLLYDFKARGSFAIVSLVVCVPLYIVLAYLCILLGNMPNSMTPLLLMVPVFAYVLQGGRQGSRWSFIVILSMPLLTYLSEFSGIEFSRQVIDNLLFHRLGHYMIVGLVVVGGFILSRRYNRLLHKELLAERTKLVFDAGHDELTGLMNRRSLHRRLDLLASTPIKSDFALVMIDLNEFKAVNDTYGHHAGDELLKGFASNLQHAIRDTDFVARLGGDEFALLISGIRNQLSAEKILDQILSRLDLDISIGEQTLTIAISVGVSLSHDAQGDFNLLYRRSDEAMYASKNKGLRYAFR